MTSIASSLGKPLTFLRYDGDQSFFLFLVVDNRKNLFCHFVDLPDAVDAMIHALLLVILHERLGLFFICPKPLLHQIFTIVGPMKQRPAAHVTHTFGLRSSAERVVNLS